MKIDGQTLIVNASQKIRDALEEIEPELAKITPEQSAAEGEDLPEIPKSEAAALEILDKPDIPVGYRDRVLLDMIRKVIDVETERQKREKARAAGHRSWMSHLPPLDWFFHLGSVSFPSPSSLLANVQHEERQRRSADVPRLAVAPDHRIPEDEAEAEGEADPPPAGVLPRNEETKTTRRRKVRQELLHQFFFFPSLFS